MEQQGRRAIGRVCPRGAESYTWQEGDTAERIARTYATTVQALQVINPGVDFATLTAGEEICLPNFIYTCISGQPYVVEDGDTFASIAARLDITTFELAERNPGVSQNNLTVGQVLCVPAKADGADDAQTPAIPLPDDGEYPALPDDSQTPVIPLPDDGEYPALPDTPTRVCPSGYTLSAVQSGQSYADLLVQHNVSYLHPCPAFSSGNEFPAAFSVHTTRLRRRPNPPCACPPRKSAGCHRSCSSRPPCRRCSSLCTP